MMAPDYAHWHGMYEVAERFYQQLIPQARELAHEADEANKKTEGDAVFNVIDEILARPEHQWFEESKPKTEATAAARLPEKIAVDVINPVAPAVATGTPTATRSAGD